MIPDYDQSNSPKHEYNIEYSPQKFVSRKCTTPLMKKKKQKEECNPFNISKPEPQTEIKDEIPLTTSSRYGYFRPSTA